MKGFDDRHRPTMPPLDLATGAIIEMALREDLGTGGDLTTDAVVPPGASVRAVIVAKQAGRICGARIACRVFELLDPAVACRIVTPDGLDVREGETIVELEGPARPVLTGERTALNLLGHLSGIATLTARYVAAVSGTGVRIADTRKTTPGLRTLEKYAVRCGGGTNHRFGLDGAVLIKDNHLVLA
ncbi:MAG: carboxylating nicotinate-nucleotide diphosphorylase, partial [Nitrospiraceae bacterium]|nr:carboxylating nicotinate-nucleotide diphosphorylase [Nitrospiraceae bacterium]